MNGQLRHNMVQINVYHSLLKLESANRLYIGHVYPALQVYCKIADKL